MSRRLFGRCVSLSKELVKFDSAHKTQRHTSFLCYRNKIVLSSLNEKYKTHPIAQQFGHRFQASHSELGIIQKCPVNWRELPNFTVVNVRLNQNLEVMLSKPCKFCHKMLDFFNVGKVYYSCDDGSFSRLW